MTLQEGLLISSGVVGALMLATVVALILRARVRDKADPVLNNLVVRIKAWWIMVALLGSAIVAGPHAVIVVFGLVSFAALREFITLTPTHRADHLALFTCFLL